MSPDCLYGVIQVSGKLSSPHWLNAATSTPCLWLKYPQQPPSQVPHKLTCHTFGHMDTVGSGGLLSLWETPEWLSGDGKCHQSLHFLLTWKVSKKWQKNERFGWTIKRAEDFYTKETSLCRWNDWSSGICFWGFVLKSGLLAFPLLWGWYTPTCRCMWGSVFYYQP